MVDDFKKQRPDFVGSVEVPMWEKRTKDGRPYFKMRLFGTFFNVFQNKYKEEIKNEVKN